MKVVIDKLTMFFADGLKDQSNKNIEELRYGIESAFVNIPKTIILLVITYYLGILEKTLLIALFYGFIRLFSFRIHLKNGLGCTIWGLFIYIGGAYLVEYISLDITVYIIVFIFCFIMYFLYAPSGTEDRPIGRKQYKIGKILTLVVISVEFILAIFLGNKTYINIAIISIFAQMLNILPITYKIFKQKGGTYND